MGRNASPSFIEALGRELPGRVTQNATELDRHGRDESSLPAVRPDAVVMARSTEDVQLVLRRCSAEGVPVVPFGVGSSLEGHILPIEGGISLDLSAMDAILDVRPDDLLAVVQAGVRRIPLNEHLAKEGLFFTVDPGADATLGGMAATGASGTTTVRYGAMRDNVLALTAVLADGTVIRTGRPTRKDSAGYDLTRLLVGSEGTLAVITELTLRVFGIPERMSAAYCTFDSLADAVGAATAVVRMGIPVARCEFMDVPSIRAVNAFQGTTLTEAPSLFFEFHGTKAGVVEQAKETEEVVGQFGASDFAWTADERERRQLWQARHNAFHAGLAARPGSAWLTTDAAVPMSRLAEAVACAEEIFTGQPFTWSMLGHAADGSFHAGLLYDAQDEVGASAARQASWALTTRVVEMGGTCTGEHGIGIGKREALVAQVGDATIGAMRAVKQALDPGNILNPGKVL